MPTVDDAADALYGAPLSEFVAERKRLSAGIKAEGDKAGSARIAELKKPTMSAWVVNQLHRRCADEMGELFDAGSQLRTGDFGASGLQRAALQTLRLRAAAILKEDGHAAAEGTLLRVQQTLQALSALGTWAPDAPGQLAADRDPPGFDALSGLAPDAIKPPARPEAKRSPDDDELAEARRQAEIGKLEKVAAAARADAEARAADVAQLRDTLEQAETALAEARREAAEAEQAVLRARRRA